MAVLGPMLGGLCLVAAQPELDCPGLRELGFGGFYSYDNLQNPNAPGGISALADSTAEAALVVSIGTDPAAAREAVDALSQVQCAPVIFCIALVPFFSTDGTMTLGPAGYGPAPGRMHADPNDPAASLQLGRSMSAYYATLFETGADDVFCLYAGELIKPHRIVECLHKSEFMAKKMSEIIEIEVSAAEDKVARQVQMAYKKFLMVLAGKVLENIPRENRNTQESFDQNEDLVKVDNFEVTAKIGAGAFGKVFKVQHPQHGTAAVKVIPKTSVNNAHVLFSIDRELCMMLNLAPHPNVVRALFAMHSKQNFYVVMEYAGHWHLQSFTKATLLRTGASTLPSDLLVKFAEQQAAAVRHLHNAMVCHRDLKPHNWIVNDAGDTVRLVDFGLAMQVCSRGQPLKQSCGSLPFCAPEVFERDGRSSSGYDGLAADIWSLAVNYMELANGEYFIERMLGWIPEHPNEKEAILNGLTGLPRLWKPFAEASDTNIGHVITQMLVQDPAQRWRIHRVVGADGLARVRGEADAAAA